MKAIFVIFASLLCTACGDSSTELEQLELQILGPAGELRLDVLATVAASAEERRTGLANHDSLAADEAMLLIFPAPSRACISNAPVSFPIDAIFLSADQEVVAVERKLPPASPDIHCHDSVSLVLETPAGSAVQLGDRLYPRKLLKTKSFSSKDGSADARTCCEL